MISQEQQIFNQIEKAKNILITFPVDWNGDAIGGALALFLFLKKMNKNAEIVAEKILDNKNRLLSFLPSFAEIKNSLDNLAKFIVSLDITNAKVDQIKYVMDKNALNFIISPKEGWFTKDDVKAETSGYKFDLIITVNAPDLESLGKIYDNNVDFFYKTTIINIDHNPHNEEFGQVNFNELNAVAVTEILFELLKDYKAEALDEDIATCLLTGIITKTKSFKTPNLTPHALSATSELIKLGARREEIVNRLYRSRELDVLKLWGRLLNNLQSAEEEKIIWSSLFKNDLVGAGFNEDSLLEAVDELIINIPQARAIIIFYSETELNLNEEDAATVIVHDKENPAAEFFRTKALIYTTKNINALDLVKEYNPSGGRKIAQITAAKPLKILAAEVVKNIQDKLDKLAL